MPAYFSIKARNRYDSLYYLAEFVVVSQHLAFDVTQLLMFSFSSSHPVSKLHQRLTSQPLHRFEIWFLEVSQLDASYTPV